jgi:predicted ATPase
MDVGQGMNQALPLVVRANVADRPDSIIVLEQPELHLHPAAHGDLAELFAKSAKENNQTFIIETHSENIILRLRKLIVENDFGFTKDDLIIYWIEDAELKGKELREITVDEEGVLSDWPEGVFNEGMKEILEMQKALRRKEQEQ